MFCPACGIESNEQLKYCTKCGVNLRRVKGVLGKGGAGSSEVGKRMNDNMDFWSEEKRQKRKRSPEEKRLNEIKTGVITSSVGAGFFIFLSVLFDAIASSAPDHAGAILRAIPFVGFIPLLIGAGMIFNGIVIGKKIVRLKRAEESPQSSPELFHVANTFPVPQLIESAPSTVSDFSIAEPTTRTLHEQIPIVSPRDTN